MSCYDMRFQITSDFMAYREHQQSVEPHDEIDLRSMLVVSQLVKRVMKI